MSRREWVVAVVFWVVMLAAIGGSTLWIGDKQERNRNEILTNREFRVEMDRAVTQGRDERVNILTQFETNSASIEKLAKEMVALRGEVGRYLLER